FFDDECAMPRASERWIDRREDDAPRSARAVRDEALATVQDPMLAVFAAARLDGGDVASGARLGETVRSPFQLGQTAKDGRESLLLPRRPGAAHGRPAEASAWQAKQKPGIAPRHFFRAHHRVDVCGSLLAVFALWRRCLHVGTHREVAHRASERRE